MMLLKRSSLIGLLLLAALAAHPAAAQAAGDAPLLSAMTAHRYGEAIAIADKSLQSRPRDPWLLTVRGMALEAQGDSAGALAGYDHALRANPTYVPALKAASQLSYRLHSPRAADDLRRLLAADPHEPAAHAMAGVLDYEAHRCEAAIAHFENARAVVVANETSAIEYASCLTEQHQAAAAVDLLQQVRGSFPDSRNVRYDLALAQMANGENAAALVTLAPAADDDPGILRLRASFEEQADQLDAAFRDLKQAVEMNPKDERNYMDMALLCLDHEQDQRAADVMTVGLRYLPDNAAFYTIRGIAYTQLSKTEDAEKDFSRAAELDPNNPFGQSAHTILYLQREEPEQARQSLQRQVRLHPADATANILLADLLLHQGAVRGQPEWEQAKAAVSRALKAKPDSVDALNLEGRIDFDENQYDTAHQVLDQARRLDPDNPTTLNRLLLVDRKLGQEDEAHVVAGRLRKLLSAETRHNQDAMRTSEQPPPVAPN
ncbi:MAG TPA: tetratricopeptide repeat protein [Acidobacteriaceae bacterium]|jgi:tetratricopeptide (TPR) repeat protein|nr:tetratricopeptide repeat protein [Acidobacteriaceae bacterium]